MMLPLASFGHALIVRFVQINQAFCLVNEPRKSPPMWWGYGKPFLCHETVEYDRDEDDQAQGAVRYCAGAMLLCVAEGRHHQGMQLGERLLGWDAAMLDQAAPVVRSVEVFLDHHDLGSNHEGEIDSRHPWRHKERG